MRISSLWKREKQKKCRKLENIRIEENNKEEKEKNEKEENEKEGKNYFYLLIFYWNDRINT